MLMLRPTCPVDYSLCNQTATIYHWDGVTEYTTTVIQNAFFEHKKTQNVDKTGRHEGSSFLLVVPGPNICVSVGDKVLLGEGEEVATREAWSALNASNVPGLVVVKWVDPKHWRGEVVHTEAGG